MEELTPTILVVEDTEVWQERFKTLLQERGYEVSSAQSLSEAEALIEKRRFDVAVVDIVLDEIDEGNRDGVAAVETLSNIGELTETIVVSGNATVELAKELLKDYHCRDLIQKHLFDISSFLTVVEQAVSSSLQTRIRFNLARHILMFPRDDLLEIGERIASNAPLEKRMSRVDLLEGAEGVVQTILYPCAPLRQLPQPPRPFLCSHGFTSFEGHLWSRGLGTELCVWFGLSDHAHLDKDEFEGSLRATAAGIQDRFVLFKEREWRGVTGRSYLFESG